MRNFLVSLYTRLFARPLFYRLNLGLYYLGLHGLGVFNFSSFKASGESWFISHLAPGVNTVFDVGANQGGYSQLIRDYNAKASIYAFEPHPKTFAALKDTADPSLHVFNLGLGAKAEQCTIYDYADQDGSSHATLYQEVLQARVANPAQHQVNLVRLDTQAEELGLASIDLLKIDTEGHEYDVLQGAGEWLKNGRIGIVHFEFNEMNIASRRFFKDFAQLLTEYRLFRLLPSGLLELSYHPLRCEIFGYQNIIAIHQTRIQACRKLGLLP